MGARSTSLEETCSSRARSFRCWDWDRKRRRRSGQATDERRAVHDRPGTRDPAFPARLGKGQPARPDVLKNHGLSFRNAFTNACMCSPARSTWMTGYFPAQHGVKYTLEEDMPAREFPQVELSPDLPNIASVMAACGYSVVYKGKWHCSKPNGKRAVRIDLRRFGFERWNPPDAGANQDIDQGGGGVADNDGRYMYDDGQWHAGREGVLAYLNSQAATQQPFFLIISLVNPHDVLFYPNTYSDAGYGKSWLEGTIGIPSTVGEDLSTKPNVQQEFLDLSDALGVLDTPDKQLDYLNFYGNLMISSDQYLIEVLEALACNSMLDNTLIIRTSDHGEMGLTHGGQRQKNFNFYEESTRVPLVFSNPVLYDGAFESNALVSHVDFLPTIASLFGAAGIGPRGLAGSGLFRVDPRPVRRVGPRLRRLHVRRLPIGSEQWDLPAAAEPYRQHP